MLIIAYTSTGYPQNELAGFRITCDNEKTIENLHEVIEQESENVGVIIDKHFIMRIIETLEIIIVENIEIFNKLIKITNN